MTDVELTVLLITYNHARFIESAVASVLEQDTDFSFELVISEDFSTDGTRELVKGLAQSHPDRIRLLLSERNLNDNSVVRRGLEVARGRFVALLDGDDYWTDTRKLQEQRDFLDGNPDCASCFHNVTVTYEDGSPEHPFHQDDPSGPLAAPKPAPISGLAEIVRTNFVSTCSVVFRTEVAAELPRWFDRIDAADWVLHVLAAQHGGVAYLDEIMAAYRVHQGGFWTMQQSRYPHLGDVEEIAATFAAINEHLDYEFDGEISWALAKHLEGAAVRFYNRGQPYAAAHCARQSLASAPRHRRVRFWRAAAVGLLAGWRRVSPIRVG